MFLKTPKFYLGTHISTRCLFSQFFNPFPEPLTLTARCAVP